MIENQELAEYAGLLASRVTDRALAFQGEDSDVSAIAFREEAFTEVVVEFLEDLGQLPGMEICYFDQRIGRYAAKLNCWSVDEDAGEVDLVTTIFQGGANPESVPGSELREAASRALRVLTEAHRGIHTEMEPASPSYDMMQRLHEVQEQVSRIRVVVLTDGIARDMGNLDLETQAEVTVEVWDLRRFFRVESSGLPYEPVEIDFRQRLGTPLPCLAAPNGGNGFATYLAVMPGELLHSLYHEFGPRLLELNVRSFLQARGKVNRGIRDTLKNEPDRFLAYNNGISVTAEEVEVVHLEDGGHGILKIVGLQIVNGGQTVASIHRARERERQSLSDVSVQAKITLVRPEHIDTLVPQISRFSNTQNKVNEADFSANHPFHVRIQHLSESVWTPGEQSRWFYERARGQYEVAKSRWATTPARRRHFEETTPPRQKFDKVLLAKYQNAWEQLPHIVGRGGQKNFVAFMERLAKEMRTDWEPDAEYYKRAIAKAIIYKRAEKISRLHKFPAYRANAIAYTVAMLSYRTAGRVDLDWIWDHQECSKALADTMYEWMPTIFAEVLGSAGLKNVTEWCKQEKCWRDIQTVDLKVPKELEVELAEGQPLPTVGSKSERTGQGLSPKDRENIARVMQVPAADWVHLCGWGSKTRCLEYWQIGIATTLATYAATGWSTVPSKKQANQGVEILRIADAERAWVEEA
jgi:hypothetical protein